MSSAAAVSGQLAISIVPTTPIYTDRGTKAGYNLAIYQPMNIPSGWYWLGNLALQLPGGTNWEHTDPAVQALAPYAVIVKPIAQDAICPIDHNPTLLWTDEGSHGDQDIEIWQPNPVQQGYSILGLFAWVDHGYPGPKAPEDLVNSEYWNNFAAIKSSLLTPGSPGDFIWNDEGAGANGGGVWDDISLWHVTGASGIIPTNTFIASDNYNNPPTGLTPPPNILQVID
jgi:hypothetical protein